MPSSVHPAIAMTATAVTLIVRGWVHLPGTDWEAYLKGHPRRTCPTGGNAGSFPVRRNGPWTGPLGGWEVPPDAVYLRRHTPPELRVDGRLSIH